MGDDDLLRRSQELLAKLFRNSPAAIGLVRLRDGVMLDINEAYERLFGWPRAEVVGRSTEELRIWVELQERARFRHLLVEKRRVIDFASKARRKNGEIFDSQLSAELIEEGGERILLVIVVDSTARKRAEASLRENEQRFRALVELSSDWYWVTDAEHRFTFREGEILHRMGILPEADYGKRRWEMPEFVNMGEAAWAEHRAALERREEFRGLLLERRSPDGRIHWATISGRPLYDAHGAFVGYHGTGRDVTLQVTAEQQLKKFNVELERKVAERTAELDAANRELEAFSYSVSHDLRAPARAVAGFSRIVMDEYGVRLPEEARALLARISRAGEDMGSMVDGLLELSRLGRRALRRAPIDLAMLARDVWLELSAADADRAVAFHVEPNLLAVGDSVLVRNLLANLLGNARKYTRRRTEPAVWLGRAPMGEYFVRDNGVGFDMAYADRLFGEFQRLHSERDFEGHGIGLALCRRIVERHGGRIRAEGAVGAGATFFFTLPETPGLASR